MARGTLRSAAVAMVAILGVTWYLEGRQTEPDRVSGTALGAQTTQDPAQQAFESRARGRQLTVIGTVERILADDRDGSPHQRFIVRTRGGLSLLVAHNLDLAPRLEGLAAGQTVTVSGEYEWNDKGGVMHWTHDDPQGRHVTGYIEWRGRRYQ